MSSTATGDVLEKQILELFQEELSKGNFYFKSECCKVQPKGKYYSKDRKSYIIFDIAIEIYRPGATQYSMLMLIECKKLNRPVRVDDIEEFHSKINQVAGVNVKGVVASTNSFQAGAMNFAQSKGIGLFRYYDRNQFQWILERSPSAGARSIDLAASLIVERGLIQEEYQSNYFDFFCQSNYRYTNSLWDFLMISLRRTTFRKGKSLQYRIEKDNRFRE